ncbi:MAG: hypothetical protein R3Y63_10235 [Eubacteriales bacterium]
MELNCVTFRYSNPEEFSQRRIQLPPEGYVKQYDHGDVTKFLEEVECSSQFSEETKEKFRHFPYT